ncbi:hypothetical protein K438DRAFT_1681140, partial [Mycena galopus ATCC 62051]
MTQFGDPTPPAAPPPASNSGGNSPTNSNSTAPTTALSIPLESLHAACLAPLAIPLPCLPPFSLSSSVLGSPSTLAETTPLSANRALLRLLPPPAQLPARLAAAHAALARVGAAPFPFPWFEARVYAFLSALASSPATSTSMPPSSSMGVNGSYTSPLAAFSAGGSTDAKATAKALRKREKEAKRERARAIFAGGAAAYAANGLPPLPPSFSSSSHSLNNANGTGQLHLPSAYADDHDGAFDGAADGEPLMFPPIHALEVSD